MNRETAALAERIQLLERLVFAWLTYETSKQTPRVARLDDATLHGPLSDPEVRRALCALGDSSPVAAGFEVLLRLSALPGIESP